MDQAFLYIMDNGLATARSYPTKDSNESCRYAPNMKYTGFDRCAKIPQGNYSKFLSAVVQQPVSVGINFSVKMSAYGLGVWDGECTTEMNKGMLVTGYGYDEELDMKYWKLKNTLGKSWGEEGYIRIKRE